MRLSPTELAQIKKTFLLFCQDDAKIFLFGSRVDCAKKGGDIDLLVVLAEASQVKDFPRLDFLVSLKKLLGERRIDVTVAHKKDLATDEFLRVAFSTAVEI